MTVSEVLKLCMKKTGVSQRRLALLSGYNAQQQINQMLVAKNGTRTDKFIRVMNAMGYDVVVKNRISGEEIAVTMADEAISGE